MEIVYTESQLNEVVAHILNETDSNMLCFHGEMGAGKTTLIKEMVRSMGGAQRGSSPTFGIVNEYSRTDGSILGYHFDFYRIENESEALDIGIEDYFAQDVWFFIEWPDKISSLIPPEATHIRIEVIDDQTRKLSVIPFK